MNGDNRISVVIATRNRAESLGRCLAALERGERRADEIVIVDQSDDDATRDIVAARPHLTIRYDRQPPRGLGAAQNVGFARATAPIVAVLDDDCLAEGRWLATIAAAFRARPDLDGLTGRVLPQEPRGSRTFAVASRTSEVRREFTGRALPWEVGSGNNFALRRTAFDRIGGCDERLGPGAPAHGGVDMDLFHRLLRAGSRFLYEPDAIVYHERQTRSERRERRPMYGHGMGAAIALWRRSGDASAGTILREWTRLRARQIRIAMGHGDWRDIGDELVMLWSTVRGLAHGWRLARDRSGSTSTAGTDRRGA